MEKVFIFSEGPVPFTNNSQINFETCKSGTKIQVEKQDKVTHSGLLSPPPQPPGSSPLGKLSGPETTPKSSSSKSPVGESKVIDSVVQVVLYFFMFRRMKSHKLS
jgi:hypothetical protein